MKESTRHNLILALAVPMIAVSLAVYASWVLSCFKPAGRASENPAPSPKISQELMEARADFRASLQDPRAHLRLSEALYRAGRLSDSFYVELAARQSFRPDAFEQAHAVVVLGREDSLLARLLMEKGSREEVLGVLEAALASHPKDRGLLSYKAALLSSSDALGSIRLYVQLAGENPGSYEGREALAALGRMAQRKEDGPEGESSRLAKEALEELVRAKPKEPLILSTLGLSLWGRGDAEAAMAVAAEALSRQPDQAGAYTVEGALAFAERDMDKALALFAKAWSKNPEDLYSAAKLAQIYFRQRADREAAFPYYAALYRRSPRYDDGEPVENILMDTLALRREHALKYVGLPTLGPLLRSEDAALRAGACAKAAEAKDPRWIDALGELLDDDAEIVRKSAEDALFSIGRGHPDALRARREGWLSESRPLLRARAQELFARLDSKGRGS